MTVFVDMDGVVADVCTGLARALGSDLTLADWPATYDLSVTFNRTLDEIWNHPRVKVESFWTRLPKLPWADELVHQILIKRFDEVMFLSQSVRAPCCLSGKAAWLQEHFPNVCYLIGSRKVLVGAPGQLLIDDYEINEDAWRERGGEVVLVPAPWNRLAGEDVIDSVTRQLDELKQKGWESL